MSLKTDLAKIKKLFKELEDNPNTHVQFLRSNLYTSIMNIEEELQYHKEEPNDENNTEDNESTGLEDQGSNLF